MMRSFSMSMRSSGRFAACFIVMSAGIEANRAGISCSSCLIHSFDQLIYCFAVLRPNALHAKRGPIGAFALNIPRERRSPPSRPRAPAKVSIAHIEGSGTADTFKV